MKKVFLLLIGLTLSLSAEMISFSTNDYFANNRIHALNEFVESEKGKKSVKYW